MQKYIMFEDVPKESMIMYPSGAVKTNAEVKAEYPILGTPMGVLGITVGKDGKLTNPIMMNSYYNIMAFEQMYEEQGCAIEDSLTNAQKCDVVNAFVNSKKAEE